MKKLIDWFNRTFRGLMPLEPLDREALKPARRRGRKGGTTLAEAKARHGKPFKALINKPRETEPSRDLLELNEKSQRAASGPVIVTDISSRRKS
jgi:hypothetical protein